MLTRTNPPRRTKQRFTQHSTQANSVQRSSRAESALNQPPFESTGELKTRNVTASLPGESGVCLIGLRINEPLMVHKWPLVTRAMPRVLVELRRQPELGFIQAGMWLARSIMIIIMLQLAARAPGSLPLTG